MKPLALIFPLALCVVVAAALLRTVPDIVETPFGAATGAPPEPMRVPAVRTGEGEIVRELTFQSDDLQALAQANEIRLTLGTFDSSPRLSSGALGLAAAECVFETQAGWIDNGAPRTFARGGACADVPAGPGTVTLTITLEAGSQRQGQLAMWLREAPAHAPLVLLQDGVRRVPAGSLVVERSPERVRRMALLAFMWERPAWQLWMILAGAGALLIAGSAGIAFSSESSGTSSVRSPHPQRQLPALPASIPRTLSVSFAAAALAGGLAISYAVIIPPFQAPDEPDHLLSFAKFTFRPELDAGASELARRVHFERIAFHPDERFRPADRETPFAQGWDPNIVFPHDISTRSSSAAAYWRLTAAVVPSQASRALMTLRLMNALVFALAFACAAVVVARSTGAARAATAIVPILTIPTLGFFGMHVSELTWPIVGFVLLGAALVALFAPCTPDLKVGPAGTAGVAAGVAIGISAALFAAGPRSAWPMAPMVAAILAGRVLLRPAGTLRESARFWTAVAAPVVILFGTGALFVPGQFYEQWRFEGLKPSGGTSDLAVVAGALIVAVAGLGLERLWAGVAARVWNARWITGAVRGLAGTVALGIAGVAAASLFVSLPQVPKIRLWSGPLREYVAHVLTTVLTGGRLADLDLLTWASFMGTFGWIDTVLPAGLNAAITAAWMIAAVALLLWIVVKGDAPRGVWLLIVTAGFVVSVAVSAAGLFGMGRSLQGRYLLGAYTVVLMLVGSAPALMLRAARIRRWALALGAGIAVVHGITITVLLHRYLG